MSLATTVFGLKCHYYAYGEADGQGGTLTQDQVVECSTADAMFCFTVVAGVDYNGDVLQATFSGCNADPIYGKLQGYSDVPVINECTQSGHTPINIPGVFTGDLTCCSSDGCNDDGGAVPGDDGGNPGSGGSGGGPRGGHHNSAGASTFGLSLLTIVVAYFFSAIPV